jgi:hypothetical protein
MARTRAYLRPQKMIDDLPTILNALGISREETTAPGVNIAWSHHMTLCVTADGHRGYLFKVAPLPSAALRDEAKALRIASKYLSGQVPEVVGCIARNGLDFLVLRLLTSRPLRTLAEILDQPRRISQWTSLFSKFRLFEKARVTDSRAQLVDFINETVPPLASYLSLHALGLVQSLPAVPQHCDMVANNVGHLGHSPVIYDWEDFGRTDLAGLDVAILIGSLLEHDPRKISALLRDRERSACLIALVGAAGISIEQFTRMLPVYYGAFLWLKKVNGYGEGIQKLVEDTIRGLVTKC